MAAGTDPVIVAKTERLVLRVRHRPRGLAQLKASRRGATISVAARSTSLGSLAAVEVQDDVLRAGRNERGGLLARGGKRVTVDPHLGRDLDLCHVATDRVGVAPEHIELVAEGLDAVAAREVPAVGQLRHHPQADLLPLDAQPDGHPVTLHRQWVIAGVGQSIRRRLDGHTARGRGIRAVVRPRAGLGLEQLADDQDGRTQVTQALTHRVERDAIGRGLRHMPAGAQPEHEVAAADVVDDRGGLGDQARMPIRVGEHEVADLVTGHERCEGRQRGHALEARPIPVDGVEVVEQPRGLEHAELAGPKPDGPDLVPGDPGGCRLETDAQGSCHRSMLPGNGVLAWECPGRSTRGTAWIEGMDRPYLAAASTLSLL